jgi:hypothetical protein
MKFKLPNDYKDSLSSLNYTLGHKTQINFQKMLKALFLFSALEAQAEFRRLFLFLETQALSQLLHNMTTPKIPVSFEKLLLTEPSLFVNMITLPL